MEDCIFCKIIKGEIPKALVWEDDKHLAFLSIQPINPGHTLVIPKAHTDYIFDLEDQALSDLMVASKRVSGALKIAYKPKTGKIGVMVAGGDVKHVHVHLVPLDKESELDFKRQKDSVLGELLKEAIIIKRAF